MDLGSLGVYAGIFTGLYFEVFLLLSFLDKRPEAKTTRRPVRYPQVAILVPCWNKAATLGATLDSLLRLDYPQDKLQIVIIDDGSTDHTWEAAQAYAHHPHIKLLRKQNEGSKYSALNFGLANTDSELVGCLDADSFVEQDALIEIVKKFEDDKQAMAVAPSMAVNRPRGMLELMQAVEYSFGVFYKKMFDNLGAISVLPGPFSFYRREVFSRIGGFRKAHHTEDMEMAFRMQLHGEKMVNVHTALVHTNVPSTLRSLVRQRTRWSRGFLENSKDYWFMFFNRKYGHFGLFVLPFGLAAFFLGLYTAAYAIYQAVSTSAERVQDLYATGIPLHLPTLSVYQIDWLYLNVGVMLLVITVSVIAITLFAILVGNTIAGTKLGLKSLALYFMLFGFVAPLWLARTAWDTVVASERGWLT